jgi:hypothetical protein
MEHYRPQAMDDLVNIIGASSRAVKPWQLRGPMLPSARLRIVSGLSPTPLGRRNFMKNDPGSSVFSMTCERFSTRPTTRSEFPVSIG